VHRTRNISKISEEMKRTFARDSGTIDWSWSHIRYATCTWRCARAR